MGIATPIHDALVDVLTPLPPPPPAPPTVAADAERVLALAWQEAAERGHQRFGTGHLLLGLVRAGDAEAELLAAAGVTAPRADAAMGLVASFTVSEPVVAGDGPPEAGRTVGEVLDAASRAATVSSGHGVTAPHLLGALLARPWGQAAEMLAALGVDPPNLADAVTALSARPARPRRPLPRDPSSLLSSAWRPAARAE